MLFSHKNVGTQDIHQKQHSTVVSETPVQLTISTLGCHECLGGRKKFHFSMNFNQGKSSVRHQKNPSVEFKLEKQLISKSVSIYFCTTWRAPSIVVTEDSVN